MKFENITTPDQVGGPSEGELQQKAFEALSSNPELQAKLINIAQISARRDELNMQHGLKASNKHNPEHRTFVSELMSGAIANERRNSSIIPEENR